MPFTETEISEHTATLEEQFWSRRRPPLHLRDQLREGQRIDGTSIELFLVRPAFQRSGEQIEESIAKVRFIRSRDVWHLGVSRRDVIRVGGSAIMGLTLGSLFKLRAAAAAEPAAVAKGGPGWGKAKSVITVYLQGGPSHLDLWDPKENVPEKVRSSFKNIPTKIPKPESLRSW